MEKVKTRVFKLDELNPAKYNPRKKLKPGDKEFKKLENSIKNFGYVELIVVNTANNNTVISGHQRLAVLQHMGETEAECVAVEMGEAEEKALNVAMNKVSGEWDEEMLAGVLSDLKGLDFDIDLTGFEPDEVDRLLARYDESEVGEDAFDVDGEMERPVFSKPGDVWVMGRHRAVCGDSTLAETYGILMEGQKANLVLTDPPYNVAVEKTAGKIMNDDMADPDFYRFLLSAFQNMHANLADDGSIYVWHADTEGLNFRKAFKDAGFYLSGCCIWNKNALVLGRSPYQWKHEPVLFGWKEKGKHQWYADRKQTTVWEYDRPSANASHPTMKPVKLMAYPIQNSTMTNGIVLDPFLGSGSTLIACCETDRECRGVELDPKFMDVIVNRYVQWANSHEDVWVLRNGERLRYEDVAIPTEG